MPLAYTVTRKRTPAGYAWWVLRGAEQVERHTTEAAALAAARRLSAAYAASHEGTLAGTADEAGDNVSSGA